MSRPANYEVIGPVSRPCVDDTTTHVGPRDRKGIVRVSRVPADLADNGRRHVDIGFSFPGRSGVGGVVYECMTRTQARVLARRILEAAK